MMMRSVMMLAVRQRVPPLQRSPAPRQPLRPPPPPPRRAHRLLQRRRRVTLTHWMHWLWVEVSAALWVGSHLVSGEEGRQAYTERVMP